MSQITKLTAANWPAALTPPLCWHSQYNSRDYCSNPLSPSLDMSIMSNKGRSWGKFKHKMLFTQCFMWELRATWCGFLLHNTVVMFACDDNLSLTTPRPPLHSDGAPSELFKQLICLSKHLTSDVMCVSDHVNLYPIAWKFKYNCKFKMPSAYEKTNNCMLMGIWWLTPGLCSASYSYLCCIY